MISLIGGVRYTADTPVVLRLHGSTALRLWGSTGWFLNNVARNSLAIISNIEIGSLELQRLWAMSKNDRVKLRATFGWESAELVPVFVPILLPVFVSVSWFLNNVARNSLGIISNIEIESLELQRLWAMSKIDRVKLRATFG